MTKLEFQNKELEKMFRSFQWARNNSIQMFEQAAPVLGYKPESKKFEFQPVLYQFQCLVATSDTYYRKLSNSSNKKFAVLVGADKETPKAKIPANQIKELLSKQAGDFQDLFKSFDDRQYQRNIKDILSLVNHEYLHHGQLIVMMREAGVDLPERFKKAFAL